MGVGLNVESVTINEGDRIRQDIGVILKMTDAAVGIKVTDRRSSMGLKDDDDMVKHAKALHRDVHPVPTPRPTSLQSAPGPTGHIAVRKDAVEMCMARESRQDQRSSLTQICFHEVSAAVKKNVPRKARREMARQMAKQFHKEAKANG